ncbi:alpha/beta fold hydrolase, partial [Actinomadura sp. DSM 109109]|nr:alpha/beta fold hydrolase [Actinomadura lepetitiana]
MRPLIGITAYAEPSVRWGAWDVPAAVIPLAYVRQIEAAGGRALLVPPSEEGADETLDALDLPRAHLAGTSCGGFLALNQAARDPERVRSLALIDPGGLSRLR